MISAPLPSQTATCQSASSTEQTVSQYQAQLRPWCIVRQLPRLQNITVARFRNRNDADAHRRILVQLIPQAQFVVAFDPSLPDVPKPTPQTAPESANES